MRSKTEMYTDLETGWVKLQAEKHTFFEIVHALNRYYDTIRGSEEKQTRSFRKRLARSNPDLSEIFFKKFGDHEYLIYARIESEGKSESDSWIHIDGIGLERDEMRARGYKDHPAFDIRCIQDLFEECCVPASKSEEDRIHSDKE
ncbi:hypothetical protein EHQ53_05640 [Leptospira langatensis]|uniref:Uncharacterized protein n=1 Tax=Leptospira langatensis TaxID=2484983 RepID=A0A5F1ZTC9_9LEPT|nr:hypothetical protein [Leptospira langatensis]TGK02948.1 hypothetical protein EHO57_06475 [Leptospira langatensis]TGL41703.1 hypothetical protein EHQ53_05640 [Leptospira langatensis]